jgi:hypothetical protein
MHPMRTLLVTASASLAAAALLSAQTVHGAPVAARHSDHFVEHIGVNTHFGYTDMPYFTRYAEVKEKLRELGIRYLRDGAYQEDWRRRTDLHTDLGIRFLFGAAGWNDTLDNALAEQRFGYIRGYGPAAVLAIEGVNEYDNSGRSDWVALLRAFSATWKQTIDADQDFALHRVVGPSLARGFYADVGDLSSVVDDGCLHWYAGDREPSHGDFNFFTWHRDNAQSHMYPGKRLWLTEMGYSNASVSEAAVAKYLPRSFLWMLYEQDVERVFSYELVDEPGLSAREAGFGMLRGDLSEKPVFAAMRNLIALLADPGSPFEPAPLDIAFAGASDDIRHVLFQNRAGTHFLAIWRETRSFDPDLLVDLQVPRQRVTLTLDRPVASIRVYEPAPPPIGGGALAVSSVTDVSVIDVEVPDHVMVIEFAATGASGAGGVAGSGGVAGTPAGGTGHSGGFGASGTADGGVGGASGSASETTMATDSDSGCWCHIVTPPPLRASQGTGLAWLALLGLLRLRRASRD